MQPTLSEAAANAPDATPDLDPGINHLRVDDHRSLALHQLICETLEPASDAWWVDGANTASTYTLYELAPTRRILSGIQVARAFTAYQHSTLIDQLVRNVTPRTDVVVCSGLCRLYRDEDVPEHFARRLFQKTIAILDELVDATDVILIASTSGDDPFVDRVADVSDETIECEHTSQGLAYETDDWQTEVYWHSGYWQTTIPYWVDLLGAADEIDVPVHQELVQRELV